ncbi:MAG: hypothetical protein KGJ82_17265 [Nitrospirota bacterium]|nr:hypothetical protein [Nitrospirota bacterium]
MRVVVKVILLVLLLAGLPLLGIVIVGQPLDRYLEFPPRTRYVQHAPFSWTVFIALALCIVGSVAPFVLRIVTIRLTPDALRHPVGTSLDHQFVEKRFTFDERGPAPHAFPWWGWLGAALTALSWVLAWNRFVWFEPLQPFTFTPLWLGYILLINAYTFKRTGRCLMLDRPRSFLWLFPLSSAFWWFFEYLNRFVQNWYYIGAQELTPLEYFLHATVPFSTVLPAVLGTMELLASYPWISAGLEQFRPIQSMNVKIVGWVIFLLASAGLTGIGIWPGYLFPLVWVAPLLLITSLQAVAGEETIFSSVARGCWKSLWLTALAALVCGFFWEMWNYKSLSHWEYAVPFVHRFPIFEMPLLGYAGYLPFGLECVAVAQFFLPECCRDILMDPSHRA